MKERNMKGRCSFLLNAKHGLRENGKLSAILIKFFLREPIKVYDLFSPS